MSFPAYPSSEIVNPFAYFCCLNRVYSGLYSYSSQTNVSSISSSTISATSSPLSSVSSNLLAAEIPNIAMEAQKNFETNPIHGSFIFQSDNLHQNLWTTQTATNSKLLDCHGGLKSSEIWRPFTPSPTEEHTEDRSGGNQSIPLFIPSRVKIEHSKTSLFRPVKKKGFRCSHCSLSFTSSAQLISHLRVHSGSKPFMCNYPNCPKTFARNEELTRHLRIHSGFKPHACHACGKTFGRKDHLSKHAKTHLHASEKRAYACEVPGCGHRYTRSDALARHRSAAHAIWRRVVEVVKE